MKDKDRIIECPQINRVEVIDENGRSYIKYLKEEKCKISVQDNGRTLKIFISDAVFSSFKMDDIQVKIMTIEANLKSLKEMVKKLQYKKFNNDILSWIERDEKELQELKIKYPEYFI